MTNRMKKIGLLALLALVAVLFAGCHGMLQSEVVANDNKDEFLLPEAFDMTQTHEITFWAKNDTNIHQVMVYRNAIAAFEQLYPNVKINLQLYTDYSRIYADVVTHISTKTTPNVCISYPDHVATYMTGTDCVIQLDDLFKNEKYGFGGSELKFDSPRADEIFEKFLEECKIGGHYYLLPYVRSTEACYVNKTLIESMGYTLPEVLTWDFVWEVSEAALEKDENGLYKVNGQKVMVPFIYKSTDNMMIQMLEQLDAPYSNEDGDVLIFNDTTKQLLSEIAAHAGTRAFSTFKIQSYPANFLNAGQCLFAVDSTAGSTWMGADAPLLDIPADQIVHFETEVLPIPQFDPEHPKMISQGPSICVFRKDDPQEVLASVLFVEYLLTNDVQIPYAATEGYTPVTSKAVSSEAYQAYLADSGKDNNEHYDVKIKATKLLLDNLDNTFVTPVFNGSASLRSAAGELIESVTKSVRRKQTVDDAYLEKLFRDSRTDIRIPKAGDTEQETEDSKEAAVSGDDLPGTAIILLAAIAGAWLLIGLYALTGFFTKRKQSQQT